MLSVMNEEVAATVPGRRLVIFDFDGTVADTKPCIVETARRALLDFGMAEEDLGDLGRLVGPPFPYAYTLVYGLSEADAAEVTRRYRQIYRNLGPEAWPAFPGMRGLLSSLRAEGRLVAVASSKNQPLLERCIEGQGTGGLFDFVRGKQSDAMRSKTQLIEAVLEHFSLGPADAVMVGDRSFDVEGASGAGVPCVGVTYADTGDLAELAGAGAVEVAGSVAELGEALMGEAAPGA